MICSAFAISLRARPAPEVKGGRALHFAHLSCVAARSSRLWSRGTPPGSVVWKRGAGLLRNWTRPAQLVSTRSQRRCRCGAYTLSLP